MALPIILSVAGLSVTYHHGGTTTRALHDVNLEVAAGERVAVIGESGSGKSTFTHALLGILPRSAVLDAAHAVLDGQSLIDLSPKAWEILRRDRIGYVPQDPNVALDPVHRVGVQLDEAIRLDDRTLARPAREEAARELLARVGFPDVDRALRSFPHQLSGGQRQRVLIAIALVGDPRLIIADEPTSGLDVAVQRTVLDLLDSIVRTSGVALVLVTHDLAVASERSDRIMVLDHGRAVESADTASVLHAPSDPYTRRLVASVPTLRDRKLAPSTSTSTIAESEHPVPVEAPLVEVRAIAKTYVTRDARAGRTVVEASRGVSLTIPRSTTYGLVGESGSGKSTLARIVAGIDVPDDGDVTVNGVSLVHGPRRTRQAARSAVQYVFQNPYGSLDPKQTVRAVLTEPLEARGLDYRGPAVQALVERTLDDVGLTADTADRRPGELSGGQRQRVAIGRALITKPELIVLDEPVSSLDVSVQAQILQLLVDLQHEHGSTYLFISHDLAVISEVSDHVGVLASGRLVEDGPVAQVLHQPATGHTRDLLAAIPRFHAPALLDRP